MWRTPITLSLKPSQGFMSPLGAIQSRVQRIVRMSLKPEERDERTNCQPHERPKHHDPYIWSSSQDSMELHL